MPDHPSAGPAPEPYRPRHHVRIVTAASLFDGHDAAINIMRRILQASGAEVIHLGHNRSVREIVDCAVQEDAQGIAVTSYQGGHVEYLKYMHDLVREAGLDIRIFAGGGGTILRSVSSAPGGADLAVKMQDYPDPVARKSLLTYEILLTNLGPETAYDVTLENTLPKGVKLQSVTATEGQCRAARLAVSCNWSDLASGQEVAVTVQVNARRRGTLSSFVSVAAIDPDDPDESNNTATETTVVEKN
jgi:methylmalonyl-CoA mutase cobalamin-binding domain/chain